MGKNRTFYLSFNPLTSRKVTENTIWQADNPPARDARLSERPQSLIFDLHI